MSPRILRTGIYGYAIMYQPDGPSTQWITQDSDDAPGIPACYETLAEAQDRQAHIYGQGTSCRICAVLVSATDFTIEGGRMVNKYIDGQEIDPDHLPKEMNNEN